MVLSEYQSRNVVKLCPSNITDAFRHHSSTLAPVRDQAGCAACWSFVITDVMYNALAVKNRTPPEALSAQYLVSCWAGGKDCNKGGIPELVYDLPQMTGTGVPLESFQPYLGRSHGTSCPKVGDEKRYRIKMGSGRNLCWPLSQYMPQVIKQPLINQNVDTMKAEISCHTIVGTIAVHKAIYDWDFSKSPIFDCKDEDLGDFIGWHAVEMLGWMGPYWIVRTSWGVSFGQNGGEFWVEMGKNKIGIESRASTFDVVL